MGRKASGVGPANHRGPRPGFPGHTEQVILNIEQEGDNRKSLGADVDWGHQKPRRSVLKTHL